MAIEHISAVTLTVRDMARAIEFYEKLGFTLIYGDSEARFGSLPCPRMLCHLLFP